MIRIGKIINTTIEKSKLIVKILGLGSSDVKTIYNVAPFGIDGNTTDKYKCVYSETGVGGERVLLGIINSRVLAESGELHLFSEKSNGTDSFRIKLMTNETCEIGGNANFAVRYNELKSEYDKTVLYLTSLKTASLGIATALDALVPGTSTAFNLIMSTQTTGDISTCKNDKIKTN
jgi:hypothetical protein